MPLLNVKVINFFLTAIKNIWITKIEAIKFAAKILSKFAKILLG